MLGVDLGTTWTAASVDGQPLALGEHGPSMPSVVAVADGELVVGWRAVRAAAVDPASAAREFKRRLGDTTPIVVAGTPYGAETLTGHLLAGVVEVARSKGHEPGSVVLTHPAAWGEYKLDLLREAARVAGLAGVELVPEPVAAAQHHAGQGRLQDGDTVAVYDFGGGTFDAAVVRVAAGGPALLGQPEGLERLGGIDLDQAVLAHVNAVLDGALSELDTTNDDVRRAVQALRADCTTAKEALSADTETTIDVAVPGLQTQVRITRAELESAVRPRLAETLGALDRVIASAGLGPADLAGVVLVGGSSRIPLVAELVASHTGRPLLVDTDPKLAVVLGTAATLRQPVTEQEHAMSTNTPTPPAGGGTSDAKPGPKDDDKKKAATGRRTDPGARAPEKSGMSTAGKVAGGLAAAGAATAAGLLWHEQITDAIFGGDDAPADPAVAAAVATEAPPAEESMDVFDAPGGGGGGGFARPAAARPAPSFDSGPGAARPAAAPRMPDAGDRPNPEFEATRAGLLEKLETWEPPEGADPAEVAALRERLNGLIERFEPRPGQSTQDAVAELRDEFDLRIDTYVQEERIEALLEAEQAEQEAEAGTDATPTGEATDGTTDEDTETEGTETEGTDTTETRDHRDGDEDDTSDAPGGVTVTDGDGPTVRDHRPDAADTAAAERPALHDPFDEQAGTAPDGPPAGGEPEPAPAAEADAAPDATADPTADDATGASQVHAEVEATPDVPAAPVDDSPTPEPETPAEPEPDPIPEPEPAMAGAGADPLANDPLGISHDDIAGDSDDYGDDDADMEPDVDDGPDDQPDFT